MTRMLEWVAYTEVSRFVDDLRDLQVKPPRWCLCPTFPNLCLSLSNAVASHHQKLQGPRRFASKFHGSYWLIIIFCHAFTKTLPLCGRRYPTFSDPPLWHLMASYSHVEISMNSENHLQAAALKSIRMKVPQGKPPWGGPPIGQNAFRRTNAVKKCPARLGDNQQRGSDFQVLFQACHESGSGWIWIKLDKSWARHPNMFSGSTMSLQPTFVTLPFKVSKGHPRPRSSRLEEPEKTGKTNHEQNWTNTGKQNEKKTTFKDT